MKQYIRDQGVTTESRAIKYEPAHQAVLNLSDNPEKYIEEQGKNRFGLCAY